MRNRLALAVVSPFLLLATFFTVTPRLVGDPLDIQAKAAEEARQKAKREQDDKTDQIVSIYYDAGSRAMTAGFKEDGDALLHKALEIADKGKLENLTVSRVLDSLGKIFEAGGKIQDAERCFDRSTAITEQLFGEKSPAALRSREDLAMFYYRAKNYSQMEAVLRQSLKRVWQDPQGSAAEVKQDRIVIPVLQQLADCYRLEKKYKEAEDTYLNLVHQVKEHDGLETGFMVIALNNLAELYREENKKTEAEKDLEYAMSIMDKALAQYDPTKARVLRALAGVKQSLGKDQEAEALHLQVLKLATDSGKVELKALGLLELASYYHDQKHDEQAEKRYDEALAVLDKQVESHNLGMALVAMAECRLTLGKVNAAAADLARARTMIEQLDGKDSDSMAQFLRTEGKCLLAQGKPADAEKVLKQAQAISVKTAGADDLTVGYTLELLGNVYTAQDNLAEAEKCYQQAAAIEEKFTTIAPVRCAEGLEAYSKLLEKMQRPDDAGKQAKRAAELRANLQK